MEGYLARLQAVKVSRLSRKEQLAYWINLYNAMTVAVVLKQYPVASIRDIDLAPGIDPKGPWDAQILTVEGRKLSLDDIENRILRPLWKDPLIHFGLNCASIGCPDLAPQAFTAENTGRLLEQGARSYVNSPRGAGFAGDTLYLSNLFDWYRGDFGKDETEVLPSCPASLRPTCGRAWPAFPGLSVTATTGASTMRSTGCGEGGSAHFTARLTGSISSNSGPIYFNQRKSFFQLAELFFTISVCPWMRFSPGSPRGDWKRRWRTRR